MTKGLQGRQGKAENLLTGLDNDENPLKFNLSLSQFPIRLDLDASPD